jgi:hypothetical protein
VVRLPMSLALRPRLDASARMEGFLNPRSQPAHCAATYSSSLIRRTMDFARATEAGRRTASGRSSLRAAPNGGEQDIAAPSGRTRNFLHPDVRLRHKVESPHRRDFCEA